MTSHLKLHALPTWACARSLRKCFNPLLVSESAGGKWRTCYCQSGNPAGHLLLSPAIWWWRSVMQHTLVIAWTQSTFTVERINSRACPGLLWFTKHAHLPPPPSLTLQHCPLQACRCVETMAWSLLSCCRSISTPTRPFVLCAIFFFFYN